MTVDGTVFLYYCAMTEAELVFIFWSGHLFFFCQELGINVSNSNVEVVCGSDVVFVAVKPHLVPHVLSEISQHVTDHHIIVSVAAGVTLATLEEVSAQSSCVILFILNSGCVTVVFIFLIQFQASA